VSGTGGHLAIRPELCDRCEQCVRAFPQGKLRVGAGYIYVDVSACTGCFSCVDSCPRGAINRRPSAHLVAQPGTGGKVVVGSRAEAKALRKQAAAAEKSRHKLEARRGEEAGLHPVYAAGAGESETAAPATSGSTPALTSRAWAGLGGNAGTRATLVKGPVEWEWFDALAVAAVLVVTLLAKGAVLGSSAVQVMPAAGKVAARAVILGVFYLAQLGLLAFLARRHGARLIEAFRLSPKATTPGGAAQATLLVIALLIATRAFSTAWGAVVQAMGWAPPASEALTGVFGGGGAGLLLAMLLVVIVAPVIEELAFRGVIAGSLAGRYGLWPGVLISAAVFSAYHMTAWVLVPTFALGCALAWLALTRQTLWPAIVLHVLYNGVVVAAAFWAPVS